VAGGEDYFLIWAAYVCPAPKGMFLSRLRQSCLFWSQRGYGFCSVVSFQLCVHISREEATVSTSVQVVSSGFLSNILRL